MPRIDEIDLTKGKFKKTKVRSWDEDLLTILLIDQKNPIGLSSENSRTKEIKRKDDKQSNQENKKTFYKEGMNSSQIKPNKNSKLAHEFIKSTNKPNRTKENKDYLSFLSEDFRLTKLMNRLSENEMKVLMLVVEICNQKRGLKTGNVSSEDFDNHLRLSRNSRETAIKRLCKKNILKRYSGKRGVRGLINLGISSKALELANNLIKREQ